MFMSIIVFILFGLLNLQVCMSATIIIDADAGKSGHMPTDLPTCYDLATSQAIGVCFWDDALCIKEGGKPFPLGGCPSFYLKCCVLFRYNNCEIVEDGNDIIYISSTGLPLNKSSSCEVKIVKSPFDSHHQIRLDFVDFNLSKPLNVNTLICEKDRLIVTSKSFDDLTVCGLYGVEHLYYTLEDDSDVAIIKFITSNIDYDRSWKIKITRVDPSEEIPIGCLQYYPNATGILQMTNFSVNGQFLTNTEFKICIKRAENICWIKYESCDPQFTITIRHNVTTPFIVLQEEIGNLISDGKCIRYKQQKC